MLLEGGSSRAAALIERHADPLFLAPDDRHGFFKFSLGTHSVNRSGMNRGVTTSSAAPVSDMLRMVQSIPPPPNSMVPAFSFRWRGAIRFSSMSGIIPRVEVLPAARRSYPSPLFPIRPAISSIRSNTNSGPSARSASGAA